MKKNMLINTLITTFYFECLTYIFTHGISETIIIAPLNLEDLYIYMYIYVKFVCMYVCIYKVIVFENYRSSGIHQNSICSILGKSMKNK